MRIETEPRAGTFSRRQLLQRAGGGLGWIAAASLLGRDALAGSLNPLAPKSAHFTPRAKSVIWIFANGGPSQVDTWDYKPELAKRDGTELGGFDNKTGFFPGSVGPLMKSPFAWQQGGQSGTWTSELFPHLGAGGQACLHPLVLHELEQPQPGAVHDEHRRHAHGQSVRRLVGDLRPRLGERRAAEFRRDERPAESRPAEGSCAQLGRGLPAQRVSGTWLKPQGEPIANLKPPANLNESRQRAQLDLLASLNRDHLAQGALDNELGARIESFELAYRMQTAAPEAFDVSREPEHIRKLYGIGEKHCGHFAAQCLTARRMVERGVRFVQVYSGGMENQQSWDCHSDLVGNHRGFAAEADQPIAALLADLEQRGLLKDTLVIWAGEFGRLPVSQKGGKPGRDHNPHAFTAWLAGGGVKGGVHYGETDEIGFRAAVNKVSVRDFHATILHALGLDHERLAFKFQGLDQRLTGVEQAHVVNEIFA